MLELGAAGRLHGGEPLAFGCAMSRLISAAPLALAAALGLSACASKPKPVPAAAATPEAPPAPASEPDAPPSLQSPVSRSLQEELAATAGDRVFFALDSHDLTGEARQSLAAQAQWLASRPEVRVLIAGNCDERGTREYNLALGARRASAARDFLLTQGVSSARIQTVSYGKERPIEAGATETAWSRNRNAGTVVLDLAPR
jgi:peptidoglycan-associated lipoprotein